MKPLTLASAGWFEAATEGWRAELELVCERRGGRTVLARKRQLGPLTVQRPFYPEGAPCHLYLLHPPGGVVGGDRLAVSIGAAPGAQVLITTPGAGKLYRSAGAKALQTQHLRVAGGAVLEWLPQEMILFPGARVDNRTQVELNGDGRFIGWEILCLGRPAIGERFNNGSLRARLRVSRDGRPLLSELLRIDAGYGLDAPSGLRGQSVSGTFIASGAGTGTLAAARAAVSAASGLLLGITLLDDLLVARCLGATTEPVQRVFCALWTALRPRLLGREACPPRIWAT